MKNYITGQTLHKREGGRKRRKRKEKNDQKRTTVAPRERETRRKPLFLRSHPSVSSRTLLGHRTLIFSCVLVFSARCPTPNNCWRKSLPAKFFNPLSYKFIVLGLLSPSPVPIKVWATICVLTEAISLEMLGKNIGRKNGVNIIFWPLEAPYG